VQYVMNSAGSATSKWQGRLLQLLVHELLLLLCSLDRRYFPHYLYLATLHFRWSYNFFCVLLVGADSYFAQIMCVGNTSISCSEYFILVNGNYIFQFHLCMHTL